MQKKGAELDLRDLSNQRLSVEELDALIGSRDYRAFLNPRNDLYRKHKMKQSPPSRAAALRMMAGEPNLIRRPVVVRGKQIVLGYDVEGLKNLLG